MAGQPLAQGGEAPPGGLPSRKRPQSLALHYVEYRASGGTDDPSNLASPCAFCHLEGEHGGRLKILPPGSNPTWLLGRRPIVRVHRRERTLLA